MVCSTLISSILLSLPASLSLPVSSTYTSPVSSRLSALPLPTRGLPGALNHLEKFLLARLDPLFTLNTGLGNGVLVGVGFNSSSFWYPPLLTSLCRVPLSRSTISSGTDALDFEREEPDGVTLEASLPKEDARRGKRRSAMTLMEGAHATTTARWFSITDHIIALAKRQVKSGRVANICTE